MARPDQPSEGENQQTSGRRCRRCAHGIWAARSRQPFHHRGCALIIHAVGAQSQNQISRIVPSVRAGSAARRPLRMVRARCRQPLYGPVHWHPRDRRDRRRLLGGSGGAYSDRRNSRVRRACCGSELPTLCSQAGARICRRLCNHWGGSGSTESLARVALFLAFSRRRGRSLWRRVDRIVGHAAPVCTDAIRAQNPRSTARARACRD
jgi:hypothetical protein